MNYTAAEVEQYVQEMDVKFVRLAFTDLFGTLKNISILAEEVPRAFRDGISFDASAVAGFLKVEKSDLLLMPDPSTWLSCPGVHSRGVLCVCIATLYILMASPSRAMAVISCAAH